MVAIGKRLVLFFVFFGLLFFIEPVLGATINITGCTVLNQSGTVYNLTRDINATKSPCMNITASNIVLDCNMKSINTSTGTDAIIVWGNTTNITIKNCNLFGWDGSAILVNNANTTSITITNLRLDCQTESYDKYGIFFSAPGLGDIKNVFIANTTVYSCDSGIGLYKTADVEISNVTLYLDAYEYHGIRLSTARNVTITNTTLDSTAGAWGITVTGGDTNLTVANTTIKNMEYGIYIGSAGNITVADTEFIDNQVAVGLEGTSSYSAITIKDSLFNNTGRINADYGVDNLYVHGSVFYDSYINLNSESGNHIYNNYFIVSVPVVNQQGTNYMNTTRQAGTNIIGGSEIGGNYYATYTGTSYSECADTDSDGFCDNPIDVCDGGTCIDSLPLKAKNFTLTAQTGYGTVTYAYGMDYSLEFTVCLENGTTQIATTRLVLDTASKTVTTSTINTTCYTANYTLENPKAGSYLWYGEAIIPDFTLARGPSGYKAPRIERTATQTLTINKAPNPIGLYINDTPQNLTTYWDNVPSIKGNHSIFLGDDDVSYCLYENDSEIGCADIVTYEFGGIGGCRQGGCGVVDPNCEYELTCYTPQKTGTYKYTFTASEGENYTSNTTTLYLTIEKGWSIDTDRIMLDEYYYYAPGKQDKIVYSTSTDSYYCNGYVLGTNYCYKDEDISTPEWTSQGLVLHNYTIRYFVGVYSQGYNVTDGLPVKEHEIEIVLPKSIFTGWDNKQAGPSYNIDGNTNNISLQEDTENITIIVGTSHSASSLEDGNHVVTINYEYTTTLSTGGGLTAGGGGEATAVCGNGVCEPGESETSCPQDCANLSFSVVPRVYELVVNKGENTTRQIVIKNDNDYDITIQAIVESDDGSSDWVTLNGEKNLLIDIPARTEKKIDVRVDVPREVFSGYYRSIVTIQTGNIKKTVLLKIYVPKSVTIWSRLDILLGENINPLYRVQTTIPLFALVVGAVIVIASAGYYKHRKKRKVIEKWLPKI